MRWSAVATLLATVLLAPVSVDVQSVTANERPPNVLFIAVDDLRPTLGCYGNGTVHSPHIDQLAAEGRCFHRHYVSSAICVPSRSAMLSGKHYGARWAQLRRLQEEPQQPISFPHLFRQNGYRTVCIGKISHLPGGVTDAAQTQHEIPFSWDRAYAPVGKWPDPWGAFFAYADGSVREYGYGRNKTNTPAFEMADVADNGYPDGLNAQEAIRQLRQLNGQATPFLLAVGFYKPHLPFNAPKKYWDLYDPVQIPAPQSTGPPEGIDSTISLHESYEVTTHYDWPGGAGQISDNQARTLRHAYYACVSYVDAQIGKVLDELTRLDCHHNTIVVLWSDHGWHLGDHGMFGKHTNFEIATRSTLIIKSPGMRQPGTPTQGLAQTIDLYPTLADLCQLAIPSGLQGASLKPLLDDPGATVNQTAFSFHAAKNGVSLRTDSYRVVKWTEKKTGVLRQVELYDHQTDPYETINVADRPEYKTILQRLLRQLDQIHQSVRPN